MPAVRLFVVAEDKAGLGRRPASSMSILLRSWWVWIVAVGGISCGTELLQLIVRFPFIAPSFRVKAPDAGLCRAAMTGATADWGQACRAPGGEQDRQPPTPRGAGAVAVPWDRAG
jgi:hypothetical protein